MYIFNDGDSLQILPQEYNTKNITTAISVVPSRRKEAYRLSIQSIVSNNQIILSLKHRGGWH